MTKKQRKLLMRILFAALLLSGALVLHHVCAWAPLYLCVAFFLPAYLLIGADVLWEAFSHIFHGRVFDEAFLMTVATIGAFCIGEYPEAVFVMLFFRVGTLFEGLATRRARASLSALASLLPDTAHVVAEDGSTQEWDTEDVPVGAYVRVLPGERVPLDGHVTEGCAALDLSALTGEALPVDITVGMDIPAGAISLDGVLLLQTSRVAEESTAARILEMVEGATDRKARAEGFITRFARVYTPIVCALALGTALFLWLFGAPLSESVYVALSFLVISCPCALVISVPLAFFAGVGCGAGHGILFKGSRELERIASVRAAAFDKTGTLTTGIFTPTALYPAFGVSKEELFHTAASVEAVSTHPIAVSIVSAYAQAHPEKPTVAVSCVEEQAGRGVYACLAGAHIHVGNAEFLREAGVDVPEISTVGAHVYVSRDGVYMGAICVSDCVREDAARSVAALRAMGISPLVLLSGDRREAAEAVGQALSLDRVYGACTPERKAEYLAEERRACDRAFLFVGDGINDAPVLAAADCGVAMGALGTDAAKYAADVVLLADGIAGVADAIRIARKTVRIVKANIVFILAVKGAVMLLSAAALVGMWAAVFADVGVSVISILNAARAARIGRK